jgi:outer membrane murein-binding lipoprotein Lpp
MTPERIAELRAQYEWAQDADSALIAIPLLNELLAEIERQWEQNQQLKAEVHELKIKMDALRRDAFAAINPANWQKNNSPEERLTHYAQTLAAIADGERYWTAENMLAMCQKVVQDVHDTEIERLQRERDELLAAFVKG